jgi:SAM-dependent methyltransferase
LPTVNDPGNSAADRGAAGAASGRPCCNESWEEAYARFEAPETEIRKFMRRLRKLGCAGWPPGARVVELFCGRGNGLHALHRLGFRAAEGVDLSATLAAQYDGPAKVTVGDCRDLPFAAGSRDVLIVQGGLHHLSALPEDLARTVSEAHRVLADGGRFVAVEPWQTPFLAGVHRLCRSRLARRLWPRLDALATMIHHERQTYEQWLGCPRLILGTLEHYFTRERLSIGWGKMMFVGRKAGPPPGRPEEGRAR